MNVLLLVDLEGVAGVDAFGDLIEGQPGFERARGLLADEIRAACEGLQQGSAAASRILISDTHRGGLSPTVDRERLPAGAALHGLDEDYEDSLLGRVQAVACLGMHAGDRGFAPHTLDLGCVWEIDGRAVSETDLFLGVAAVRGLPAIFLAGDAALDPRGLPFVATKHALSPIAAVSRPVAEVLQEIRQAAAGRPVASPHLHGRIAVRFRSRWMAEAAEREGHLRLDETAVWLPGPDLRSRIRAGRHLLAEIGELEMAAFRPWALAEDAATLARRLLKRSMPPGRQTEARRALEAFLARTEPGREDGGDPDSWTRANRALTLHMLEAHAPAFFAAAGLAPVLANAVSRLDEVPRTFPPGLDYQEALARLEALYVWWERTAPGGVGAPTSTPAGVGTVPVVGGRLFDLGPVLESPAGGGAGERSRRGLGPAAATSVGTNQVPTERESGTRAAEEPPPEVLRGVDRAELARYLSEATAANPPFGWLLGEVAHQLGLSGPVPLPPRAFRRSHRFLDLAWVTHLVLLETHYLRRPLPATGWESLTEELLLAVPETLAAGQLHLAARLAFCLVAAGEHRSAERAEILAALAAHQQPDGRVVESSTPAPDLRLRFREETRCTGAALLAFATAR